MNIKIITQALFFCSFSLLQCMESTTKEIILRQKDALEEKVRRDCYHCLPADILNIVKQTQENNIPLTQEAIDRIFVDYADNDQIRPLMLSLGANINTRTKEGRNCLWAMEIVDRNGEKKLKYNIKVFDELIGKGINVDIQDNKGETPFQNLFSLCNIDKKNAIAAARIVLTHSANPHLHLSDPKKLWGATMSTLNSDSTCFEAAKLLCDYKVDVNSNKDGYKGTPLMNAVKRSMIELITLLLKHGASPDTTSGGYYSLYVAMEKEKSSRLYHPLMYDDCTKTIMTLLLQYGANPNIKQWGHPLLHIIIKHSPDVSTALGLMQLLFEYKVDVNAQDSGKRTPLYVAEEQNKPELVQELLKQGAVKNLCDNLPETKTLTPIEKEISEFHVINNEEPSTITKHRNFILSIIDGYRGQK